MNRFFLAMLFCLTLINISFAQSATQQKVFTQDIDNFWIAYDSVKSTKDSILQAHFVQTLYVDKSTPGLKSFMKARNYSTALYVKLINQYPEFWASIRSNTLSAKNKTKEIEASIAKLKILYPEVKSAKMYFTIGGLRSGGTTKDSMVLIGAEIATGDSTINVSEFPNKWLAGVFREQSSDNLVSLNVHEYIHTQQNGESNNLLAQAIAEGSCDFMAELVIGKPLQRNYITYGIQHKQELKEEFKKDMFTNAYDKWLYNGGNAKTVADLGYFMGYDICRSYYANAKNKKQAIKEIIELNYSDTSAVEMFLKKSKYYIGPLDKEQLLQSFREKQPQILSIEPFNNGDTLVDTSLKQIIIVFSKPMGKGYSIEYGDSGKDLYPITGVAGFLEDKTRFIINVDLKPNHGYEFVIANRSFSSLEGYPLLKDYLIKFKTKP